MGDVIQLHKALKRLVQEELRRVEEHQLRAALATLSMEELLRISLRTHKKART